MNEDPKHPSNREVLDEMVQRAFRGDIAFVEKIVEQFGAKALQHLGGPVAVTNCETCLAKSSLETCYHCCKEPWMRTRADIRAARKDLAQIPRYLMMSALHAACFGGHVLIVDRLLKYGADVDYKDELGCTPLHWITCNGHRRAAFQTKVLDVWDLLFKYEADVTVSDASGKVPIELTVPPNPPVIAFEKIASLFDLKKDQSQFMAMRIRILKQMRVVLCEQLIECCQVLWQASIRT